MKRSSLLRYLQSSDMCGRGVLVLEPVAGMGAARHTLPASAAARFEAATDS